MPTQNIPRNLPPIYHIGVVVKDIESATRSLYSTLGIGPWEILDYCPTKDELMIGKPYKIKVGAAQLGATLLKFLQPVEGDSVYSRFIETKGEGLHHIAFSVPNWDERVAELTKHGGKMIAAGIGFERRWAYFELNPGNLIIEFKEQLNGTPLFSLLDNPKANLATPEHICVVVKDIAKTGRFLYSLFGLGPWDSMDYIPERHEVTIGPFPMSLKWALAKLEPAILELIQPVEGPTVWTKFLEACGEGLHHIAFSMPNYDEMVSRMTKQGSKVIFANSLHGKRSCYIALKHGGLIFEFADAGIHTDYYRQLP